MAQLHDEMGHLLDVKTLWHERNILLKAKAPELGQTLTGKDLAAVRATARSRVRGQMKDQAM